MDSADALSGAEVETADLRRLIFSRQYAIGHQGEWAWAEGFQTQTGWSRRR